MYKLRIVYTDQADMVWHVIKINEDRSVVLRKITSQGNFHDILVSPVKFARYYRPFVTEKDFSVTADVLKIPTIF